MASSPSFRIDLLRPVQLIHRYLSRVVCAQAWGETRTHERSRKWFLERLVFFWVGVAMFAPKSLRQALAEGVGQPLGSAPVEASPQAFFARSQHLRWQFFRRVFEVFRRDVLTEAPRTFAAGLRPLFERFGAIHAVDGSRLDRVRRRLKMLWKDRRVPLPGMVVALYDLATGTIAHLAFDARAKASEFKVGLQVLSAAPSGSLLVGDRLYGVMKWFAALAERDLFAVARRFGPVLVEPIGLLSSAVLPTGEVLEDWRVMAGSKARKNRREMRRVCLKKGTRIVLDLLTNVLDPVRLSAVEACELYSHRWSVERLFSDLKEVLNLKHFYGANTNAVAMQLFATAIVHTAMRVSQALVAQEIAIEPERLSPAKLFPKLAAASLHFSTAQLTFLATQDANPQVRLVEPDWTRMRFAYTTLDKILVEPRTSLRGTGPRRKGLRAWRDLPQPEEDGIH